MKEGNRVASFQIIVFSLDSNQILIRCFHQDWRMRVNFYFHGLFQVCYLDLGLLFEEILCRRVTFGGSMEYYHFLQGLARILQ